MTSRESMPAWPKDPVPWIAALAKEQNRPLSKDDYMAILIYERALAAAYRARLEALVPAARRAIAEQRLEFSRGYFDDLDELENVIDLIGPLPPEP